MRKCLGGWLYHTINIRGALTQILLYKVAIEVGQVTLITRKFNVPYECIFSPDQYKSFPGYKWSLSAYRWLFTQRVIERGRLDHCFSNLDRNSYITNCIQNVANLHPLSFFPTPETFWISLYIDTKLWIK